jgi:hypothetical protein
LPTSVELDPAFMKEATYDIEFSIQSTADPELKTASESRFLGSPTY